MIKSHFVHFCSFWLAPTLVQLFIRYLLIESIILPLWKCYICNNDVSQQSGQLFFLL